MVPIEKAEFILNQVTFKLQTNENGKFYRVSQKKWAQKIPPNMVLYKNVFLMKFPCLCIFLFSFTT